MVVDALAVGFPIRHCLCRSCNGAKFFRYEFVGGAYKDFELWVCSDCGNIDIIMPSQEVEE